MKQRHFRFLGQSATACLLACALILNSCARQSTTQTSTSAAGPGSSGQLDQVAVAVGGDSQKALDFVTNKLGYDIYAGALRGSRGAVLAGAGNAVDKSLLLRDLIQRGNPAVELRFAFCTLPSDQAQKLAALAMASSLATPAPPPRSSPPPTVDPQVKARIHALLQNWRTLINATSATAGALASNLKSNGLAVTTGGQSAAALAATASAHVWLQRHDGANWVDLDPTLGTVGQNRCTANKTATDLPEDLYHHLAINVRVEQRSNGALSQRFLMQTYWRAADISGSPIAYLHAEPSGLDALLKNPTPPPSGMSRYTPLLAVNGQYGLGEPIYLPTIAAKAASVQAEDKSAFGAMTGKLPGAQTAAPAAQNAAAASGPEVTALWLEFDITGPDGKTQRIERPIFDRIGFVARAYGQAATAPLAPLAQSNGEYDAMQSIWNVVAWTGEHAYDPIAQPSSDKLTTGSGIDVLGGFHRLYFPLRESLAFNLLPDGAGRFVASGVNVSALTYSDTGANGPILKTDRIRDAVDFIPGANPPQSGLPAGVTWGVAALSAERYLYTTDFTAASAAGSAVQSIPDVLAVFERAKASATPLVLLKPGDEKQVASLDAAPEARARIWQRLANGDTVLVPKSKVAFGDAALTGWWVIDRNGFAGDELQNGGHQGGAEYGELQADNAKKATAAQRFGNFLKNMWCAFFSVAAIWALMIAVGWMGHFWYNVIKTGDINGEDLVITVVLAALPAIIFAANVATVYWYEANCKEGEYKPPSEPAPPGQDPTIPVTPGGPPPAGGPLGPAGGPGIAPAPQPPTLPMGPPQPPTLPMGPPGAPLPGGPGITLPTVPGWGAGGPLGPL